MRWAPHNRSRAFTLAEIIVVIVILGIASAIVIPRLGTHNDLTVAAAARQLTADLLYAQNLAISTQTMHVVRFDTANNQYTLLKYVSPSTETILTHPLTQQTYVQKFGVAKSAMVQVVLSSAVFNGLDSGYQNITAVGFDELGTPYVYDATKSPCTNDMVSGTITLTCGTFTSTITIDRYTGEIRVQ
jgi:prepilin-type N-terminal cleavage/methylation domain-containing protein